ncbi:hypothetical protein NCPPB1935_19405 [Xanthomonas campestris pv. nigromaculans]|nr:hypothetical protein NCPPB1935_19405 [Xanthomonas campestris pv. nigromaculans]
MAQTARRPAAMTYGGGELGTTAITYGDGSQPAAQRQGMAPAPQCSEAFTMRAVQSHKLRRLRCILLA